MAEKILITICFLFCAGCASLPRQSGVVVPSLGKRVPAVEATITPIVVSKPVAEAVVTGTIFGKTDFKGLLKAAYVRLTIVDRKDPAKQYYFFVGSHANLSVVPWGEGRVIEPGYFGLSLPVGEYKVTTIAIPVGSTKAEETLELDFKVAANVATYVGTLDMDGTKEKVKFGGVPLIRPGFEYVLNILDEWTAAQSTWPSFRTTESPGLQKGLFLAADPRRLLVPKAVRP
ncbi:MAG: hypothetical protein HQL19_00405 [Candidatus Omnitrophica bacterium]|nr:hypothetical protein [Candidatus Omnitrophota bacterium]